MKEILLKFKIPKKIEVWCIEEPDKVKFYQNRRKLVIISELQLLGTFYIEGIEIKAIEEAIKLIAEYEFQNTKFTRENVKSELAQKTSLSSSSHRNTLITLSNLSIISKFNNKLTPYGWK